MSILHRSLKRLLTGAVLKGVIVPADKGGGQSRNVACLVEKLEEGSRLHEWVFHLVMTPGGNGEKLSLSADVRWAASVPVVSFLGSELPGVGEVQATFLIQNRLFAGTWSGENGRGHVYGVVESAQAAEHRRVFVIERSSEYLREWWTGSGWSEDCREAQWFEHEPDAPRLTGDEEARAVYYPSGEVEPG